MRVDHNRENIHQPFTGPRALPGPHVCLSACALLGLLPFLPVDHTAGNTSMRKLKLVSVSATSSASFGARSFASDFFLSSLVIRHSSFISRGVSA